MKEYRLSIKLKVSILPLNQKTNILITYNK